MTKQELAQELTEFAKMAFVDSMNPETVFLTRNRINPLTKVSQVMAHLHNLT